MQTSILLLTTLASKLVTALNPVLVKGNVFYDSVTNERVVLKGVDYQPWGEIGIDPLTDPQACARDLFLMQQLGVNIMRVYTVDSSADHDECMSIYNAGGIYLMLDVNSAQEGHHLNREEPWTTYNKEYVTNVFKTMTVFSGYSNVIGYFTGNELINSNLTAQSSPAYIKAITRDMKAFTAKHLDRPSIIGYSAADNIDFRTETAEYMSCGDINTGKNDFYAINSYQFCGNSDFHVSGYDTLMEQFKDFSIPLFFSEVGCNAVKRTFKETDSIFGPEMTGKLSGCLVYQWTEEANNYGLVKLSKSGDVELLEDFDALQRQYNKISNLPKSVPKQDSKDVPCPPASHFKNINAAEILPVVDEVEAVIQNGVTARKGKLSDVKLFATKYTITDSKGNEITEKTPKQISGVSSIDLSKTIESPTYSPTSMMPTSTTGSAGNSSSSSESGTTTGKPKSKNTPTSKSEGSIMARSLFLGVLSCSFVFAAIIL